MNSLNGPFFVSRGASWIRTQWPGREECKNEVSQFHEMPDDDEV